MSLDVVVVNYKTPDLLEAFQKSFYEHSWEGCSILSVEVEAGVNQFSSSRHTLSLADNVGYGRACNAGARFGTGEVILLANADTVLSAGLRECHDALLANPDWGVLGPRQVDDRNFITAGGIYTDGRRLWQNAWHQPDVGQCSDVVTNAGSVSGSLYFVKRAVWQELTKCPLYQQVHPGVEGAFLPTRHFYEETFCSIHAREHGYKTVFYGPVKMIHYWHRSHAHGSPMDYEMNRSLAMHREACAAHGMICE